MPLTFSVLSEFRGRLLERGRERQLFEELLAVCQQRGWVKAKGKIRTDSTHVMAAVRQLNRLELVGESLRAVLNQLAVVAPDWLRSHKTCQDCPARSDCTRAKTAPRSLHLKPQPEFEALRQARLRQATPLFQQQYDNRAGIEGTLSQAVRAFDLRICRYRGLAKTRLQHLFTATATNLARIAHWLMECPRAKTRISAFAALAPQPTAPAAHCIAG